jgi:hypothetical protein
MSAITIAKPLNQEISKSLYHYTYAEPTQQNVTARRPLFFDAMFVNVGSAVLPKSAWGAFGLI